MFLSANDTMLFCTNKNLSAVQEYKGKVENVALWCKANRITIITKKCQAANFVPKTKKCEVSLGGKKMEHVGHFK